MVKYYITNNCTVYLIELVGKDVTDISINHGGIIYGNTWTGCVFSYLENEPGIRTSVDIENVIINGDIPPEIKSINPESKVSIMFHKDITSVQLKEWCKQYGFNFNNIYQSLKRSRRDYVEIVHYTGQAKDYHDWVYDGYSDRTCVDYVYDFFAAFFDSW